MVAATNILTGDSKPVTLASHLMQAFRHSPPHPQSVCQVKRFRCNLYRVTRSVREGDFAAVTNSPQIPMACSTKGLFHALSAHWSSATGLVHLALVLISRLTDQHLSGMLSFSG